jgi:hypothetical protein
MLVVNRERATEAPGSTALSDNCCNVLLCQTPYFVLFQTRSNATLSALYDELTSLRPHIDSPQQLMIVLAKRWRPAANARTLA